MTLEQLRIFVAVAERQHVTQAAQALNLTQSAVSSAVAALEQRHGVALFDRVGRGVALNPVGEAFLGEARAVLARAEAAEAVLSGLGDLTRGRLSIQASQTIASYWLPPRLAAFHRAWPGVTLDVAIGNTRQAARAVAEGLVELGFVEGEVDEPSLDIQVVDHDDLAVLVAPGHAWATTPPTSLAASPWVLRETGSGTRSAFEALLAQAGCALVEVEIALTLPSNEAVRATVEAGVGAALLSRRVASGSLAGGRLVEVALDLPARAYFLLRHKQRYRSRAGDAFLDLINQSKSSIGLT